MLSRFSLRLRVSAFEPSLDSRTRTMITWIISTKTYVQVHQLSVNYGHTPALWDISVDVPAGKLVGIVGPNGAGKSTFIEAVLGLADTISGKVEFFGQPLSEVRRRVAYVPQRESVGFGFSHHGARLGFNRSLWTSGSIGRARRTRPPRIII